jgi:hypothetical protein
LEHNQKFVRSGKNVFTTETPVKQNQYEYNPFCFQGNRRVFSRNCRTPASFKLSLQNAAKIFYFFGQTKKEREKNYFFATNRKLVISGQ